MRAKDLPGKLAPKYNASSWPRTRADWERRANGEFLANGNFPDMKALTDYSIWSF
jgi:hypothetical protein